MDDGTYRSLALARVLTDFSHAINGDHYGTEKARNHQNLLGKSIKIYHKKIS